MDLLPSPCSTKNVALFHWDAWQLRVYVVSVVSSMVTWVVRRHSALSALWPGIFPLNRCCFALFGQGGCERPLYSQQCCKDNTWFMEMGPAIQANKLQTWDVFQIHLSGFHVPDVWWEKKLSIRQAYLLYCSLCTMLERNINVYYLLSLYRKFNQNHSSLLHGCSQ